MGCCFGKESSGGTYSNFNGGSSGGRPGPETPQDREARLLAAEKAMQRQQNFEQSAVGRAAYTAVKDAKKPINNNFGNQGPTARDWQS